MDLVILVAVLVVIGFLIWLLTSKVQMPPYWANTIQIGALIVIVLYLLLRFAVHVPNVLPR